eukprot:gene16989-20218_t
MLKSGHQGLLVDKVKRKCQLYMSNSAIIRIAKCPKDAESFDLLYQLYGYRFTLIEDTLSAPVRWGNLHAFKRIHRDTTESTINKLANQIIVMAFTCPNADLFKYVVDNIPVPSNYQHTVYSGAIKPGDADKYQYIKSRRPDYHRFFANKHHIIGLCDTELFDETYPIMTDEDRRGIMYNINDIFDGLLILHDPYFTPTAPALEANLQFIGFVEYVLKACAKDDEEVAKISSVRPRIRSLSTHLTPEKETYLTLLGFFKWITPRYHAPDQMMGSNLNLSRSFGFIIKWNDPDLTGYLLDMLGLSPICNYGTLEQVKAAHSILGSLPRDMIFRNEDEPHHYRHEIDNVDVLWHLCRHGLVKKVDDYRLISESNLGVLYFMEAHQHIPMYISKHFLVRNDCIDVLRMLANTTIKWIDYDSEHPEHFDDYQCRIKSIDMVRYLIEINHSFEWMFVSVTCQDDLPMIQLYINHMKSLSRNDIHELIGEIYYQACKSGLLNIVRHLYTTYPGTLDISPKKVSTVDDALSDGHMEVVDFLLRNGSQCSLISLQNATFANDIGLFQSVRANSPVLHPNDVVNHLLHASKYGRLEIIKHIICTYPVPDTIYDEMIRSCQMYNQYHVVDYYLCNYKEFIDKSIITSLADYILSVERIGCLQVLLKHFPDHHQNSSVCEFIASLPHGTINFKRTNNNITFQ